MSYPLSQAQLSIYLACQHLRPEDGNYQQASLYKLPDDIDLERLRAALEAVVQAHPAILARIGMEEGEPRFFPSGDTAWEAPVLDTPSVEDVRPRTMDLTKDTLFRMEIHRTPDGNWLYLDFHHIIFDGASAYIIIQELEKAYGGEALPPEPVSGFDIALEEEAQRKSPAFEEARKWYQETFAEGADVESGLLPDVAGETGQPYRELLVPLPITPERKRALFEKHRAAESVLATSAFGIALGAWSGDTRASFSTIWNGRKGGASRRTVTMCVHTQPVWVEAGPETGIDQLLETMKQQTVGLRQRHFYSFADCTNELGLHPAVNFGFQGKAVAAALNLRLGGHELPPKDLRTNPPGIGLAVELFDTDEGGYLARFWYAPDQYSEGILRAFADSYSAVLSSMASAGTVGELAFATPGQLAQLDGFNPGPLPFDPEVTVLELFREHVLARPDHPAVINGTKTLTYRQLDLLSDHLAAAIEKQVGPGGVVAIMLGRNEYMAVAPMGALKAGCAYVPLDPTYPAERLKFMVEDAGARLLIADPDLAPLMKDNFSGPVLTTGEIPSLPDGSAQARPAPDDLFVLLYTSGTTGVPKGCMLCHRNVSVYLRSHAANMGIGLDSRLTAYASFGFDAFVGDLYGALGNGAALHIVPEEIRLDLPALHDWFERSGITHGFMTTQVATQFALNFPSCKGLEALFMGGEKMADIPLPQYRVFNCYGPTESLCYVISKEVVKQERNIPIGKPLPGIHAYVVAKGGQRLPAGAAGELLEAGLQVGKGYLGRPEKTAESFAVNPYEADPAFSNLYRTGDIVRYRPDGDIEYIGRRDMQVKIRGFRIELKEVESAIREYPGIGDVTVQAFDEEGTGGGKYLAAYVVSSDPVDFSSLGAFLLERKPPYMVPAAWMQIEAIPLNVNQKVDRKALPRPQRAQAARPAGEAPFNILEEELAALVRETARIDGFTLTEPLFYAGLSSLSALRLATELYKRYGVKVEMGDFVKTASLQTIENEVLKALLSADKREAGPSAHVTGPQELTHQQKGVYLDCMKNPLETLYNIPMAWTLPEGTDPGEAREAALAVLRAHPSLHSRFELSGNRVLQVPSGIEPDVSLEAAEDPEAYKAAFTRPFNLSEGPLYRVSVVTSGERVFLFTDFHHLVFDGRSYDVFIQEFTAAMEGKTPETESYTYFDYAADQKAAEGSEAFREARDFFARRLEGVEEASGVLPDLEKGETAGREAWIVKDVQADVAGRSRALGISGASWYLAAAYLTVGAFAGTRKVAVCTISNGRSDLRTADTMGMFVNTLSLTADIGHGPTEDFLRETDRVFSETLSHENYPFAMVAADSGFQPRVMVAYQVGVLQEYAIGGREITGENLETGSPKFPLSIFIDGVEGKERIVLAYDDSLYSSALMQSFADTMETVVRHLGEAAALDGITLVDGGRLQGLDAFNRYSIPVETECTVVDLFRRQVAERPDAPAVFFEGKTLTYKQLDRLSDAIAAYVAELGFGREDVVSILIGRSAMMAVASLGVLKAGCAYQPLDPSYPAERLNFMVQDANAKLLIADPDILPLLTEYQGPVLGTDRIASLPGKEAPSEGPAPGSLFILLYTSGSTGVPKGVMLEHRNLMNFCAWYRNYYRLTPDSRVAAYASFGFDACMMDLYPALTTGACVYIIPEETRHDMSALDAFITENGVTHSFTTTQVGVMFAKTYPGNPALRHLSVGGEKLVSMDPPSYGFHNGYGPTECTIFTTIFDVKEKEANIPIGRPLDNVHLYVVDDTGRRLPVGAAGELWVSGPQVGRGYLNRPEKTAETFLANPFESGYPYDRVYRTGDIVRWRCDGNIEFVGRNDGQVKIRGFRVETKEVEAVIREFPGVQDVTVQPFDSPFGGKFIAAYVVCGGSLDTKALSAFILERKPPYMVPAAFAQLDRIPLNVNQKVDRKALPAPVLSSNENYVEPVGQTETALCDIFAGILGVEKVGALDNFFDLGGTSLMVTSVLVAAESKGLKFSYGDVFAHPTARRLAAFLSGESPEDKAEDDIARYDYAAIDQLLQGNTLEALAAGEAQPLGGNIVLTGATGFLGVHVLRELIERTPEDTVIWCILRGKGSVSAAKRLSEMLVYYFEKNYRQLVGSRIRLVEGDITDTKVFDALIASGTPFETVINCAANVKHFSKGDDIEKVNYTGVKNLVAFCEAVKARLVQVSTESVGGMTRADSHAFLSEQSLFLGQNADNQYVHSKFLAERHILQQMAEGRLNAKIIRAGNLSPRAEDGEFQINFNSNAAMGRLRAYQMLGASPYPLLDARMEFSPIDQSAQATVLLAGTPAANCVFNVSNDHLLPMDDILSRLHKADGTPLDYVEQDEFIRRMTVAMTDPDKAAILSSIVAYASADGAAELVPTPVSTAFTMQVLHRLGFRWDQTSSTYVDMIFDMLSSMRFFGE